MNLSSTSQAAFARPLRRFFGAQRLPRLVGPNRAREVSLFGTPVNATTALVWGIVNRVVPLESMMQTAEEMVRPAAAVPSRATLPQDVSLASALVERSHLDGSLSGLLPDSA